MGGRGGRALPSLSFTPYLLEGGASPPLPQHRLHPLPRVKCDTFCLLFSPRTLAALQSGRICSKKRWDSSRVYRQLKLGPLDRQLKLGPLVRQLKLGPLVRQLKLGQQDRQLKLGPLDRQLKLGQLDRQLKLGQQDRQLKLGPAIKQTA